MKYIYYDKNLRCRLKKSSLFIGQIELQLQKRFIIFWFDCFRWMTYEERKKSESSFPYMNPMRLSYQFGNECEVWDEVTMTVNKRAEKLFNQYFEAIEVKNNWNKKFESL